MIQTKSEKKKLLYILYIFFLLQNFDDGWNYGTVKIKLIFDYASFQVKLLFCQTMQEVQ